jgi:hypothetical protein
MSNKQGIKKLKTNTQQRDRVAESAPEKGEKQGSDLHVNFYQTKAGKAEGQ